MTPWSTVVTQWSVWLSSALFCWPNELEIAHGVLWRWQTLCWRVQWHWHKASLQPHIWALPWQSSASWKDNGVFWNHKAQYNNSSLKCYCWVIFWHVEYYRKKIGHCIDKESNCNSRMKHCYIIFLSIVMEVIYMFIYSDLCYICYTEDRKKYCDIRAPDFTLEHLDVIMED